MTAMRIFCVVLACAVFGMQGSVWYLRVLCLACKEGERVNELVEVEGGRRPKEGNDERVDDLNGQGNDQGMEANRNVEGANGGAPDFLTIIAQKLQNLLPAMLAQVSNRGNVGNQNGNVVNENVQENVRNVIVNGNRVGCSYKEFLACNPKEYDGKGGAIVLTRWIKKMEYVHDMSGCSIDQNVKCTVGSFVGKALTWWNSQIHTLSKEVAISMSWNDFKFMMIQEFCPSHEMQKLNLSCGITPWYVYSLALQIRRMVAATEPKTMQKAVQISGALNEAMSAEHPIVTIPLLPDFGGVTDGTRAKNPSSLIRYPRARIPDP
ncbi:hypothetical protein Tco_0678408 [Tanacetum coccineum]|uniref:Reverse transcriptase domain-containing protein n=1 Tax=Tanacetum coccineum TaxID=301880 RepID=A0ABQ4XEY7_9ASTR